MFCQTPIPIITSVAANNGNGNASLMDNETYLTCLGWHCFIAFVLFFGIAYAMRKKWVNKWIGDDDYAFLVAAIFSAFWEICIVVIIFREIFEKIRGK
jgi:hypothetical protein